MLSRAVLWLCHAQGVRYVSLELTTAWDDRSDEEVSGEIQDWLNKVRRLLLLECVICALICVVYVLCCLFVVLVTQGAYKEVRYAG